VRPSLVYVFSSAAIGISCVTAGILTGGTPASAQVLSRPSHASHIHHQDVEVLTASLDYTVRSGDTLSGIAITHDVAGGWQALYGININIIRNPNDIYPGQTLKLDGTYNAAAIESVTNPAPPSQPVPQQAPVQQSQSPAQSALVSTTGDSALQQCIISRESGGNPNITNASGHYGLYQFSASTWEEYGGSAGSFGDASVAQQNQVYDNAIAAGGASNWTPYDGC
jgi:LysM repeat protein